MQGCSLREYLGSTLSLYVYAFFDSEMDECSCSLNAEDKVTVHAAKVGHIFVEI